MIANVALHIRRELLREGGAHDKQVCAEIEELGLRRRLVGSNQPWALTRFLICSPLRPHCSPQIRRSVLLLTEDANMLKEATKAGVPSVRLTDLNKAMCAYDRRCKAPLFASRASAQALFDT